MDGSDMAFDYKAVAAGIARSEGMGALLPVVEKELLHYRILSSMQDGGFFGPIVFQGGTSLRLCHGSPRYSEDLDFAGGTGFGVDDLRGLGECVRSSLAGMSPDVQVKVREPVRDEGLVRRWRISIRTAAQPACQGLPRVASRWRRSPSNLAASSRLHVHRSTSKRMPCPLMRGGTAPVTGFTCGLRG